VVVPKREMMFEAKMFPEVIVRPASVVKPPPPIDVIPPWKVEVAPSPRIVVVAVVDPTPIA